jgi:AcrR family transcriptional regulator
MSPASRPRSTRDRPAKAPLSEEAVVDAALAILKSDGPDAVTMRRIAAALDTGPASLYVYVSGREGLLQAMQDRAIASIKLETPDPVRWRAQLHSLLERTYRALAAHPGIAALAMARPLTTESALLQQENLLAILLAGGLDPQDAAWAADIFAALVTHAAIEDDVRRADRQELGHQLHQLFTGLPADRFPFITAYAGQLVAGQGDERFRFAIDVVIDGLLARAARQ